MWHIVHVKHLPTIEKKYGWVAPPMSSLMPGLVQEKVNVQSTLLIT